MKHSKFTIGMEFTTGERHNKKRWRCTDVGTRIITAIQIDSLQITSHTGGKYKSQSLTQQEAEEQGWFNGPPYAVAEIVFDEDDQEDCRMSYDMPEV